MPDESKSVWRILDQPGCDQIVGEVSVCQDRATTDKSKQIAIEVSDATGPTPFMVCQVLTPEQAIDIGEHLIRQGRALLGREPGTPAWPYVNPGRDSGPSTNWLKYP